MKPLTFVLCRFAFTILVLICLPGLAQHTSLPPANPFSLPSTLPYQAPDFARIRNEDFRPALEAGIAAQLQEIEQIANNPAVPTFSNTLEALERSGQLLNRVNSIFSMVTGANNNDLLQKLQVDIAPKLAGLQDAIYLNTRLFNRLEKIYKDPKKMTLPEESRRLLEYYYQEFLLAGAKLSEADKIRLKKLNAEEAELSAKFSNQLLGAAKEAAVVITSADELKGLSAAETNNFAENAKARGLVGKWLIPIRNTTQQPPLQSMENRDSRKKLFMSSWTRAERNDSNDTRTVITRIANIRAQKAKLVGFSNYAVWKLQDQMAKSPASVDRFFGKLAPAVRAKAKQEATEIQLAIDAAHGDFKLMPWDWDHFAEQVRKAKYNLEESEVKPYFELNRVLEKGVFYAASQLYGLSFKERKDIPVYQPDVRVFEVFDKDGHALGLFYGDYFKRDNKSGGAWMSNAVGQSYLLGTKPVIYNVCNFTKPLPGEPALLSFDDVTTMFHEFGHALHGFFASQRYPLLSGTNVARDFVEFPSQFNEHWALDPKVLGNYAVHYKTGAGIPLSLISKIKKAGSFNKGYAMTEAVAAASLDMQWHKLSPEQAAAINDVDVFERRSLQAAGLDIAEVPPRYRSSYFLHIWSNGYAAGYYAYQWTKMLEEDAYGWFIEHGGLTRANGQRFRDLILSRGNTIDYNVMFRNFRGRDPDIKALQLDLGLPVPK